LDFDGNVELRFEVFELLFFRCEVQPVVIEAYLAERNSQTGVLRFDGQGFEIMEEGGAATGVGLEGLCGARVYTYCSVT